MSTESISKSEFKPRALEHFRHVETTGEAIVITSNGRPAIEIRRYRSDERTPLEKLRGSVVDYHDPTAPVLDESEWEALA